MTKSKGEDKTKYWLLGTFGVVAASATSYLLAFAYESGYTRLFGIPTRFIKLNLVAVLMALLSLAWLCLAILGLINAIYPVIHKRRGPIRWILVRYLILFIPIIGMLLIYSEVRTELLTVAKGFMLLLVVILCGEFVLPLVIHRGKGTYREKLKAATERELETEDDLLTLVFGEHKKRTILILLLALILCYSFSYNLGRAGALRQKDFLVLADKKETVVLRIYGDKLVCAPFDRKTKKVKRSLVILDSSAQNELRLDWEEIGPLKLADKDE